MTVAAEALGAGVAAEVKMLAEATRALLVGAEVVAAGTADLVGSAVERVGPPALDEVIGAPAETVAAGDGMADLATPDAGRRGVRGPPVEFEADDRVAEEVPGSSSAAAAPAVMMPTAVPIPNSTANAPTRPIFTA